MSFLETSAKEGLNIEEVFMQLCTEIISKIDKYDRNSASPQLPSPGGGGGKGGALNKNKLSNVETKTTVSIK